MKLQIKISILFITLHIFAVLLTSVIIFEDIRGELEEKETTELSKEIQTKLRVVELFLDRFEKETNFASKSPTLVNFASSLNDVNAIERDEVYLNDLKENIQNLFVNIVSENPSINKIRYIDNNGNEIIKIEQKKDNIQILDDKFLQNKSDRYYFNEAQSHDGETVYVSNFDLNEEFGEVVFPYQPIVRYADFVIDNSGKKQGLVILNINLEPLTEIIESSSIGESIMIDKNGYFLLHPNDAKEFSLQLSTNYNYYLDQPELKENVQSLESKIHMDDEEGEYRIWEKIYYDSSNPDNYWVMITRVSFDELFAPVDNLWTTVIFASFGILAFTVIITIYFTNRITSPILKLKQLSTKVAKGNFEQKISINTHDEISELADSIESMSQSLQKNLEIEKQIHKKQLAFEEEQKKRALLEEKTKSIHKIEEVNRELSDFKLALDNSALVAITDVNGIITYANDMFCEISKYSKKELIGENHRILKSDYHTDEFYKNLWNTITQGKIWHGDICNKAKDGTIYWVRTTIMPIFDEDGKPKQYIAIRTNITSQIELASRLIKSEKMSSIGQFASRMSHDLRNPLSVIQVSLENLKLKYNIDDFDDKSFDKIERSIDRMTHQIDDVLDFVRETPLKLKQELLSKIITESIDSLTIPNNIKLILPKNDVQLLCDKRQFLAVLNNLILNSIQSIYDTGTIEITVEENDNAIIIQVKDSGIGISKEDLDKIFDPLFTTKQKGTGLGLAGVNSIIKSHGGTINVTSPPTVFTITLPRKSEK